MRTRNGEKVNSSVALQQISPSTNFIVVGDVHGLRSYKGTVGTVYNKENDKRTRC